jgi:pimeloyl-ACP methyl ester carboxylesterase
MSAPAVRVELASGIELHLIDTGRGPTLFLLHGGMGDCTSWGPQLAALSRGYRVIAYSRRHSSPNRNRLPRPHSLDDDVDDLGQLQHLLGTGPCHLAGTSYGALVALAFAMRHPTRVLGLVLTEPPLHRWACRTATGAALYAGFMNDVWAPAARAFDAGADAAALRVLADGMAGRPVFDSFTPARAAAAMRNACAMKALTGAPDPFPDLSRAAVSGLACATLLVRGERCSPLHLCVMEELALALPAAAQAVIGDAGHGSPAENPGAFNAAVLSFLSLSRSQAPAVQKSGWP